MNYRCSKHWPPASFVPSDLLLAKNLVYDHLFPDCTIPQAEKESKEYEACTFQLNQKNVAYRTAKITPSKSGQFVTTWKRKGDGPIEPFDIADDLDFLVIGTRRDALVGQFVFPKAELVKREIISVHQKEGKRGIRVYPPWDIAASQQARNTQTWQLRFFLHLVKAEAVDLERALALYTPLPICERVADQTGKAMNGKKQEKKEDEWDRYFRF